MTVDYTKVAVYDVRSVLWSELQAANLLDPTDYYADGFIDPLIPIIPAQQIPEFNNLLPGKTYIVYDVVQRNVGVGWWMSEETLTLDIVSTSAHPNTQYNTQQSNARSHALGGAARSAR